MDMSDISKVANRKRMNADAEKLREKVSRETAKIIKLKVAQDTAYWDLKEKLAQTERNHERLQQNMVDVQMQLEVASAQCQDELRMRPDTLNKVSGTRDMCDVLESHAERLRRGLERCRADQQALAEAYRAAAQRVRARSADHARERLRARLDARHYRDTQAAAAQQLEAAERRAAAATREAGEARAAAAAAGARAQELAAARADLAARFDACAQQLQHRDEAAGALQENARRLVREFEARCDQQQSAIAARSRELEEALKANESLRTALERQEEFTREIRSQSERLQEQVALGEQRAAAAEQQLRAELQDAKISMESLKQDFEVLTENKKVLEEEISDKNQLAENMMVEAKTMKECLERSGAEKLELEEQLNKTTQECASHTARLEELAREAAALEAKLADDEAAFQQQQSASSQRIGELERELAARARDVEEREQSAARAAAALAAEREERARADAQAAALRRRADDEAAARRAALENTLAEKEAELAEQMTMILEFRAEKERLQERIRAMRTVIDDVQKLTGHPPAPRDAAPREAPERPLDADPRDNMVYNFLSDSSVDGDALDATEVNRRFEALGRGSAVPRPAPAQKPIPLSQIKAEIQMKNRVFFKNKRLDGKLKNNTQRNKTNK